LDLAGEINDAMLNARKALLENFDEDVQERLRIAKTDTKASLDRMERLLMRFSCAMLDGHATFDDDQQGFALTSLPPEIAPSDEVGTDAIPLGRYELPRRRDDAHVYRLQHPLAQTLLRAAQRLSLPPVRLTLDYDAYGAKVSVLEALRGGGGVVAVQLLRVQSLGETDEYLLAASTNGTDVLDSEVTERLLTLPGEATPISRANTQNTVQSVLDSDPSKLDFDAAHVAVPSALQRSFDEQKSVLISNIERRNLALFSEESEKLDAWADDLKVALEHEIKDLDRRIKELRTRGKSAATLDEKLASQKEQRDAEAQRDKKRRELFARQDEIQGRRDQLIVELEQQLGQRVSIHAILCCEWELA
jgi:hypothetical protein